MNISKKVTIILLNYNSYLDTSECLDSLRLCKYDNFDIYIVDNDSQDSSLGRLKAAYPECIYIESRTNLGFAGGCNLGLQQAVNNDAEYCLLLNNDTTVDPYFLNRLVECAERKPNAGLVGGKIFFHHDKNLIWDAGGKARIWKGQCTRTGGKNLDRLEYSFERTVDFVTGCLMLIPRHVLLDVGFLPECYFFGIEEWDYGFTVRKAGYELWYTPNAHIWHKVGGSHSDVNPVYYYNFLRGRMLFMSRHANKALYLAWMMIFAIYSLVFKLIFHSKVYEKHRDIRIATRQAFIDNWRYTSISERHLMSLKDKFSQ